jgi:hypothetical protein
LLLQKWVTLTGHFRASAENMTIPYQNSGMSLAFVNDEPQRIVCKEAP